MGRDQTIDIAKGIGIVLVVWGHTACPIKSEIYLFHMPLFFFLSGYLFNDKTNIKDIIRKKIRSLIIPYIFFFIFAETSFIILYTLTERSAQIALYPSILIKPYGVIRPLWFLLSLFQATIIYSLICRITIKSTIRLSISIILAVFGYFLSQKTITLPLFLDSSISMVIFFNIGSMAKQYNPLNSRNRPYQIGLILFSIPLYTLGVYNKLIVDIWSNTIDKDFILYILTSLSGLYLVIFLSYLIFKTNKFLTSIFSFLGKESLLIFALHILSFELARTFLGAPALEKTTYLEGVYTLFCGVVLSLIIGLTLKKVFPSIIK